MEKDPLALLPRKAFEEIMECAEEEAIRALARVKMLKEKVKKVSELLTFEPIPEPEEEVKCIVAVDGSVSDKISARIGASFGLCSAAGLVFERGEIIDYPIKMIPVHWVRHDSNLQDFSRLLMAYNERKMAVELCQKYKPDLILLDGPFFFFEPVCRSLWGAARRRPLPVEIGERFLDVKTLIKETTRLTAFLLEQPAAGIIKRGKLRAIDGWLLFTNRKQYVTNTNDKFIMANVMPEKTLWSYNALTLSNVAIPKLTSTQKARLFNVFQNYYSAGKKKSSQNPSRLLEQLFIFRQKRFRELFGRDYPPTERSYIRYREEVAPFEVETSPKISPEFVASQFLFFHNAATGLPLPTDMVDQYVSLPKGVTTSFVEEIEARVLQKGGDPKTSAVYMSPINPEKKERI